MRADGSDATVAFKQAAEALNDAADNGVRREVYAAFRKVVKPLGEKIVAEGSSQLPHRGGLSSKVASAKMSQSNSTTGRNPGVALKFRSVQGWDMRQMDNGRLRHPVYADKARARSSWTWVNQTIRPGIFTRVFDENKEPVQKAVLDALEAVTEQIARNVKGPR